MLLSRLILGQVILWHTTEYLEVSGPLISVNCWITMGRLTLRYCAFCQYADEGGRGTETAFNG